MADWSDLARDSLQAANEWLSTSRYRSCVSRAYYAAYAAVTSELTCVKGIAETFYYESNNPSHSQVIGLLDQLKQRGYSDPQIRHLKQAVRVLRRRREEAVYAPHYALDRNAARLCRRQADYVVTMLGSEQA